MVRARTHQHETRTMSTEAIKKAVVTAALTLAVIYVARRVSVTRSLVDKALAG